MGIELVKHELKEYITLLKLNRDSILEILQNTEYVISESEALLEKAEKGE